MTTDVIVVGAGPAGAATAILLAERGLSVHLLDRARFPRPKICGEYLSPEAPRLLDRLGALKAVDAAASALSGMRITAPDGTTLVGTYRSIGGTVPLPVNTYGMRRCVAAAPTSASSRWRCEWMCTMSNSSRSCQGALRMPSGK